MPRLTVSSDHTHLQKDGVPFFLCADTVWSTFVNIEAGEWSAYLAHRKRQGFNAMLISILPILHDRTLDAGNREPFETDGNGHYDYARPNGAYFARGRAMVAEAVTIGMVPILVPLWVNYVEGTWGAERTPWAPMDDQARRAYLALVADTFADLDPIFAVSGDAHLKGDVENGIFRNSLEELKRLAPHCLTTLHTAPSADPPESLTQCEALDFYSYQSGHHLGTQHLITGLAALHLEKPRRPIMNAEPCYEGIGGTKDGNRFSRADIRKATWRSVMAGASAGVGYGAHGVWQWHRESGDFNNMGTWLPPFSWFYALSLPGAEDVGFAARLIQQYGLVGAAPRRDLVALGTDELSVAQCQDVIAAYSPYAQSFSLACETPPAGIFAYDLDSKLPLSVAAEWEGGHLRITQPEISSDFVAIINVV